MRVFSASCSSGAHFGSCTRVGCRTERNCNHITCKRGRHFCFLCGTDISVWVRSGAMPVEAHVRAGRLSALGGGSGSIERSMQQAEEGAGHLCSSAPPEPVPLYALALWWASASAT